MWSGSIFPAPLQLGFVPAPLQTHDRSAPLHPCDTALPRSIPLPCRSIPIKMCEGPREDQGFGSPGASNTPELPAEFDVVILGTGLPQSVVSAACSRADKRVLHLERSSSHLVVVMSSIPCLLVRILGSAISCAKHAGSLIRAVHSSGVLGTIDKGIDDPQTEADRQSHACIVNSLKKKFPEVLVIGEEDESEAVSEKLFDTFVETEEIPESLLDSNALPESITSVRGASEEIVIWVDPLDATREFIMPGLEDAVTVLIGIAVEGRPVAGVIHQPFPESKSRTIWALGDITNAAPISLSPPDRGFTVVSSSGHFNQTLQKYADATGANIIRAGGAGNKVLMVLDGLADSYFYPREGTKKWDVCGPHAVLQAVGGVVSDGLGEEIRYGANGNQDGASAESKTDQTFQQFLASEKLSRKLVHFLFHVISMSDDSESTSLSVEEGLKRIREFIRGIGRYKNRTPFLWPLYGSGEMPQAFCRLSAVFGGIFVLGKTPEAIVVKRCVDGRQQVTAVRVQGQEISCQHLVLAPEQLPLRIVEVQENGTTEEGSFLAAGSKETSGISRAMFLFDRPVIHSKRDEVTLVRLSTSKGMVNALELGSLSSVVPDGLVLLQLSMVTPTSSSVEEDLEESIRILTQQPGDERKPLWSLFFRRSVKEPPSTAITGIHILRPVELGIHVDPVIEEARRVFSCVYPDEEFLPRAPDPDEIILFPASEGDEGSNAGVAEKQEESTTTPEQQNGEFGPEVPEG
ncbi:unnamed protein product [Cyprideis torosa]|uniref:3'(2'),5'-bisphosphate nucleotidase 1 n=1 Tax=Cyprideis torosa TaxID=163714 RepID=A0A7R8ZP90_9CRUS|nr:unnamed protein product [Cyprideis torosa]CAG0887977.1 unnamed protein product [Cyprideis torosa]